ncbi:C-type lectin domain family 12 member A-like [Hemitrygon akajei]|uniref:C-type lectin domain family 12 member A-like n=1 Tax=Hemitrygon akajei TaxID=2704970 RepID=UPI003BF96D1E
MDRSEIYMNVKLGKTDSPAHSRAAEEPESKVKIGNRPYRLICLLCLVTSALIVTVAGLSIYVSQIRQSKITSDRNYHELNSTLQSKLSALNSNLFVLKRQFTEMETKYRSVNQTKAQICELLTSRREQTCPKDWITNKDRCYYVSTFGTSLNTSMQECSNRNSRLLEINSKNEMNFIAPFLVDRNRAYWIGKCEDGKAASGLLYHVTSGTPVCTRCTPKGMNYPCNRDRRFICERSAPLCPAIAENLQGLC